MSAFEWDDGDSCRTCDGHGCEWCEESDTAEGCRESDCDGVVHRCHNCGGSGRAKDQVYW